MSPAAEPGLTSRLARAHLTSQLGESLNKEVVLACWVRDVRVLGAASFVLLSDMSAIVQVTAPRAKAPAVVLKEISGLDSSAVGPPWYSENFVGDEAELVGLGFW